MTNFTYYGQHKFVHDTWVENWAAWSELSPGEQWDLHMFYMARHSLSIEALIEHRRNIVERDESLPQRAGRALRKLEQVLAGRMAEAQAEGAEPTPVPAKRTKRRAKDQVLTMRSMVHPEPDMARMIKALRALVEEMAAADRAAQMAAQDDDQDSAAA
ncbi:hypothetical protein [Mycobacteroides abscessus]|uniref:hypothetical protein n=1 Tax=Mycobacteroides abscessus TaxID=36809 RepID=UPI0010566066|nr:hypothetical protein [Mycobacteroides abscessus]